MEVGPHDHLLLWPRWQRMCLTIGRSRARAPSGALFFHFCSAFSVFFSKVLVILLRFSLASAWVGHIETRTQSMIYTGTKGRREHSCKHRFAIARLDAHSFFSPFSPPLALSFAPCISLSRIAAHHWLYCFMSAFSTVGQLC